MGHISLLLHFVLSTPIHNFVLQLSSERCFFRSQRVRTLVNGWGRPRLRFSWKSN